MEDMLNKIIAEVQQNLEIPGYTDKDIRDIAGMVLTIAFAMLNEKMIEIVKEKRGKKNGGDVGIRTLDTR